MFSRKIFEKLKEQSQDRKISLLLGARQVGKTTLLKHIFSELLKNNNCLFLDIDILSNYEKVSTFENLLNTLKLQGYKEDQKDLFYLFLDEFQRYPSLVKVMKNVYDNLNNIKIYASGSSSLSIKDQVQESLAGRKKVNEILPLDFEEFLSFKQKDILIKNLTNIKTLHGDNLDVSLKEYHQLLKEFLVFGGYPGVVLETARNKKMEALSSIFDLYVKKDLVEYINAEKILPIKTLIEFLAVNNGQKIKYDEITRVTSLNFKEIKRYIELLKETYIIELLRPFYTNKNKEIIKIPKIYFLDNGVRNFFIKNFNDLSLRNDAGFLFEGFVFSEFLKADKRDVNFWQDKNGNEVDLIIKKDEKIIPVEVKFKKQLKSEDLRGLESFSKEYIHSTECYLVNIGSQKRLKNINFVLPYSLSKIF